MNPRAIHAAKERLQQAKDAFADLENPEKRKAAWVSFLTAASAVYSKLEQGSKTNGKSRAWYGRRKHERKTDELLSYVHHARNAEEHGLEESAQQQRFEVNVSGPGVKVVPSLPGDPEPGTVDAEGWVRGPRFETEEGAQPVFKVNLPGFYLFPVTDDRYGDTFDVPTEHLGQPFESRRPVDVAQKALTYLEAMIADAEALDA